MTNQKSMPFAKLEAVAECLYGRSWKSQLADFLVIDRRRVNDWEKSRIVSPFVSNEILELVERRKKELNYIDMLLGEDFDHAKSMLAGETLNLDHNIKYTEEMVIEFLNNQQWTVKQQAKYRKSQGDSIEEVIELVENIMLGENDIASWFESNNAQLSIEIDRVTELRADSCFDVTHYVESVLYSN